MKTIPLTFFILLLNIELFAGPFIPAINKSKIVMSTSVEVQFQNETYKNMLNFQTDTNDTGTVTELVSDESISNFTSTYYRKESQSFSISYSHIKNAECSLRVSYSTKKNKVAFTQTYTFDAKKKTIIKSDLISGLRIIVNPRVF